MAKSYRIDAKSKTLKETTAADQIPYGDSVVSSDHLEKCSKKNSKSEASIIAKLGISDKRAEKAKAKYDNWIAGGKKGLEPRKSASVRRYPRY